MSGDEEFSQWGNWGTCSTSCGPGTRKRSRYCIVLPTYPPAEDSYCTLPTDQYMECYEEPCVGERSLICYHFYGAFKTITNVGPL